MVRAEYLKSLGIQVSGIPVVVKFIANIKSPLLSVSTAPNGAYALPANCSQLDGEPGGFVLKGD
jgi:hypothetical protein